MGEYIPREAVIDLITRRYENPEICTQEINQIPSADVAPVVHGVWLESISMEPAFGGGFIPRRTYFCSECGMREKIKWPYCHCGAKMDGGMEDV